MNLLTRISLALKWRINFYHIKLSKLLNFFYSFFTNYFLKIFFVLRWHIMLNKWRYIRKNRAKPTLLWCPVNIINHKYWSASLKEIGYDSITVADTINFIAGEKDFDFFTSYNTNNFYDYIIGKRLLHKILYKFVPMYKNYLAFDYVLRKNDIVHTSFLGTFLRNTPLWKSEGYYLNKFGIKIIILPFGADMYKMSEIKDILLRHTYISHNPHLARNEENIDKKIKNWVRHADVLLPAFGVDGMGYWSALPSSTLAIDTTLWKSRESYNPYNGFDGVVNIVHTPNHRYLKGTEYLLKSIHELKKEGLQINLILLEKINNSEVRRIMQEEADILAEQFVFSIYALSAVEGMSSGLPVLANLDDIHYTRAFRLHSYLNECPILSTSIEQIKNNLRILITNPKLRKQLGIAGRKYVEKYHSYKSSQYMFSKIYDKIWYNKDVDLMNMYHPLNPDAYNNQSSLIEHPLVENKIPEDLMKQLNI